MSQRDLVVLGTASAQPTRHRNHNGYLFRWGQEGILFDPGEGTQRQFTFAGVASSRVTRIALTHLHGDHCLGLPGLMERIASDTPGRTVPLHYPESGQEWVDHLCHASIGQKVPLDLQPIPDSGGVAAETPLTIRALPLRHRVPVLGWRIDEPSRRHFDRARLDELGIVGPAVGQLRRQGWMDVGGRQVRLDDVSSLRPGVSAAIVMDTALCDEAIELAAGVDLLLCEATFLESERHLAEQYGHLTAGQAARIAAEANVGQLVLTHLSARYTSGDGHLREARAVFDRVSVAEDLAGFPFGGDRSGH